MREIKFRAWDKKKKEMVYSGSDNFYYMEFYEGVGVLGCHNIGGDPDTEIESFELMQYTGLHDKNGKEIYEGDIVEVDENPDSRGVIEYLTNVPDDKYDELNAGQYVINYFDSSIGYNSILSTLIQVIGNIYETPELLKGV